MKKLSRRYFFIFMLFLSSISSLWGQESDAFFDFQETVFPAWKSSQWHERVIGGIVLAEGLSMLAVSGLGLYYSRYTPTIDYSGVALSLGFGVIGTYLTVSGWNDLFQPWNLTPPVADTGFEQFRRRFHSDITAFTIRRITLGTLMMVAGAVTLLAQSTVYVTSPTASYTTFRDTAIPPGYITGWGLIGMGGLQALVPTSRELSWWAHLGRFPL